MTQIFDENGNVLVATVVSAGPLKVLQIKTKEIDGYTAVQVGSLEQKESRIKKAQKGHFQKSGGTPFKYVREFRISDDITPDVKIGDSYDASVFSSGDIITVSGITKGKGFQGVVKRHGFSGGPRTHGQKHSEREGGSIGAKGPQRVFKKRKMPGRMGSDRISVKNLKIIAVNPEKKQLLVSGAVPGRRGTLLEIKGI